MKMNNNQGKMDAQDALPPLIERVDQQLNPFSQAPLHPRLDLLHPWVIFRSENYHVNTNKTVIIPKSVPGVGGGGA